MVGVEAALVIFKDIIVFHLGGVEFTRVISSLGGRLVDLAKTTCVAVTKPPFRGTLSR